MSRRFVEIARTGASQQAGDALGEREAQYLARADTFYLATVSETGWPYVQHRGGPRGFLRMLSPTRLGYADFRGNLQYLSTGNAARNDRASILVMDYAERRRLKLLGRLRFLDVADADAALVRQVELPGYPARIERVALFDVAAFDWNCPQHITPRFTLDELRQAAGE
jgi:predicted pyridoxine 5'-phosphate oxidase superfamily flavin-nucleotide-binding protein